MGVFRAGFSASTLAVTVQPQGGEEEVSKAGTPLGSKQRPHHGRGLCLSPDMSTWSRAKNVLYFHVLADGGDALPEPAASPALCVCPVETSLVGFRPELVLLCFCVLR